MVGEFGLSHILSKQSISKSQFLMLFPYPVFVVVSDDTIKHLFAAEVDIVEASVK